MTGGAAVRPQPEMTAKVATMRASLESIAGLYTKPCVRKWQSYWAVAGERRTPTRRPASELPARKLQCAQLAACLLERFDERTQVLVGMCGGHFDPDPGLALGYDRITQTID